MAATPMLKLSSGTATAAAVLGGVALAMSIVPCLGQSETSILASPASSSSVVLPSALPSAGGVNISTPGVTSTSPVSVPIAVPAADLRNPDGVTASFSGKGRTEPQSPASAAALPGSVATDQPADRRAAAGESAVVGGAAGAAARLPIFVAGPDQRLAGATPIARAANTGVLQAAQKTDGLLLRGSRSTQYTKISSGSVRLESGELLVSVRSPSRALSVYTPAGTVTMRSGAASLVRLDGDVLRVINLSGTGGKVTVRLPRDTGGSQIVSIATGYEFVTRPARLEESQLRPSDGVARRNTVTVQGARMGTSEVYLPSVMRESDVLSTMRSGSSVREQRVIRDIVKTAAALGEIRGSLGFAVQQPGLSEPATQALQGASDSAAGMLSLVPPVTPSPVTLRPPVPPQPTLQAAPSSPPQSGAQPSPAKSSSVVMLVPTDVIQVKAGMPRQRSQAGKTPRSGRKAPNQVNQPAAKIRKPGASEGLPGNIPASSLSRSTGPGVARAPSTSTAPAVPYLEQPSARSGALAPHEGVRQAARVVRSAVQRHPEVAVAVILAIAGLLALSLYLAHMAWVRARALKLVNRKLTGEIRERELAEQKVAQLNTDLETKVAEMVLLNKDLELARDQALDASKLKSEFVANISHEIRTPISAVLGLNAMLLETALSKDQREYAELIGESAQSLLSLINELLDFSKIEAGKLTLEHLEFSPAELAAEVQSMLSPIAKEKGLALSVAVEGDVPESVIGDPGRLRQVLFNLAGNAIKFTSTGSVSIRVSAPEQSGDEAKLLFSVADTGIGIPEHAMEKLFQPFVQVDGSATRQHGGTGLGLSICKHLVDLMGGRIEAESMAGKGSRFFFTLPLSLPERAAHPLPGVFSAPVSEPCVVPQPAGAKGLILVAEDSPVLKRVVLHQLQKLGYEAHFVTNGREAVEAVRRQRYAAVLMDWQMPEMDGLEATRLIRDGEGDSRHHIPIIAMTANAMEGDQAKCLAAGMDEYISKPFTLDKLQEVLQALVKSDSDGPARHVEGGREGMAAKQ